MGRHLKNATLPRGPALFNRFVMAYIASASVKEAAAAIGVDRVTVYRWKWSIPLFAEAWAEADELIADGVRDELSQRSMVGIERMTFAQGRLLTSLRERSDGALIRLLQYHDRRKS
jgi:hypothetical protein